MDEELIIQAKNGNKEAFTVLMQSFQKDLYRIAKTRLKSDYDIADAIQETMINAYKHIKKLKDLSKFKSWIIKILINECNKIYKRKSRNDNVIEKINIEYVNNNLYSSIYESNSKMDFEILIDKLNYDEKLIVTLFYNSNYSCKEISDILKMNVNTVKSKLLRAKEKVRNYYKGGILNG